MELFTPRGKIPPKTKVLIEVGGAILVLLIWWAYVHFSAVKQAILPSPIKVITCIPEMITRYHLIGNTMHSILLNILGYLEAIVISVVLGYLIGLFPFFRALSERYLAIIRFLPLTAVLGIMTAWLGIGLNMVMQFLALGIFVYLLPVVVQRIDEVKEVYVDTLTTLGASQWQKIKYAYIPDVRYRLSDDIRILVAISWTYIVIAEMINSSAGGIGSLVFVVQRQQRTDMVYAIILIILLIGFFQDKLLVAIDKIFFPYKYLSGGAR